MKGYFVRDSDNNNDTSYNDNDDRCQALFFKKKNGCFLKNNVTEEHRDPSFLQEL